MNAKEQQRVPLFEALERYVARGILPFHVPGHKQGRGLPEFNRYFGEKLLSFDLTCLPDLDNLAHPEGPIKEAERLAAKAYGADEAYFLVNGTTSGVQAMILATCKPGDKLLIPRNAHKSAWGGLILSGAVPVYLYPEINRDFGISTGISPAQVERALKQHPEAKGVFVVYPNYYGTVPDLAGIVKVAHTQGVPVIVDEAHGAHFHFHPAFPPSALACGADLVASSTHKLLGSLTQSSLLLLKKRLISPQQVQAALDLCQTTSPSYLLMCSLDLARRQAALRGKKMFTKVLRLSNWVRKELKKIKGLLLLDQRVGGTSGCVAFDPTKITVNVRHWGLSGYAAEKIFREQYHLQAELADLYNILFLLTIGDNWETAKALVAAFQHLAEIRPFKKIVRYYPPLPNLPQVALAPREAFYGETKEVSLGEAEGEISAELITAYPPGIPLICPGEVFTSEIINYIQALKQEQAELEGPEDPQLNRLKVLEPGKALSFPCFREAKGGEIN